MTYDQEIVYALYKRLLRCYPKRFREQLGDSMEQTFHDLYQEKQQTQQGLIGFTIWAFTETILGIIQEYIAVIKKRYPMKNILANLRSPALISLLLILPFMLLELVNRQNSNEGFPVSLFVIMWILPMLFILTAMPIVRNVRAGNSIAAKPISLTLRVAFLALIALIWMGILIDQMPCFLGVPNCD